MFACAFEDHTEQQMIHYLTITPTYETVYLKLQTYRKANPCNALLIAFACLG